MEPGSAARHNTSFCARKCSGLIAGHGANLQVGFGRCYPVDDPKGTGCTNVAKECSAAKHILSIGIAHGWSWVTALGSRTLLERFPAGACGVSGVGERGGVAEHASKKSPNATGSGGRPATQPRFFVGCARCAAPEPNATRSMRRPATLTNVHSIDSRHMSKLIVKHA